ncbi:hypothetical protein TDB9533_04712 [Thalassocella blandensis]|nr:hypothetical protein TDB9533_04712 [Thalassocella blandensis]
MKKPLILLFFLLLPVAASAHRLWFLPAATVLSGEDAWVTFDAAVSNDIFYFNHFPLKTNQIQAISPTGKAVELKNTSEGKHRSTFDLHLEQEGTYKVYVARSGLRARWEDDEGKRHSWPRRGEVPKPGDFEKAVPQKAKNLEVSQTSRRVETFVTAGAPSTDVFKTSGEGLELKPLTHPNDLYAGEEAKFQFLIDGEPAAGAKFTAVPGGMRYRNEQKSIEAKADKKGVVTITWPSAAMYWVEVEYQDSKAKAPATTRSGSYIATLEVLPQ